MVSGSSEDSSLQKRSFVLSVAQVCSLPGVDTVVAAVSQTSRFPEASPPQSHYAVPDTSSWAPQAKVAHWKHEDHQSYQLLYFSLKFLGAKPVTEPMSGVCEDALRAF